jgi:opacity protein-like surface antigen
MLACALASGGAVRLEAQTTCSDGCDCESCWSDDFDACDESDECCSTVPRCMLFVGAGAGLGLVGSPEQSVYNLGISQIYDSGQLVATGTADGPPVTPTLETEADCVPFAQLGYFRHFDDSNWLWGVKQSYSYIGANMSVNNLNIPQYGTSSNPNIATFEGYSVTRSYEVFTDHQFALTPFLGKSFQNGFIYGGAGASLNHVGASLNDVVGFATIGGEFTDISGRPQTVKDTDWAFGVAATAGVTYFVTPKMFLDLSYTFANPFPEEFHVESAFHNEFYAPRVYEGTLIGDYTAEVTTHLLTLSLNVGF